MPYLEHFTLFTFYLIVVIWTFARLERDRSTPYSAERQRWTEVTLAAEGLYLTLAFGVLGFTVLDGRPELGLLVAVAITVLIAADNIGKHRRAHYPWAVAETPPALRGE